MKRMMLAIVALAAMLVAGISLPSRTAQAAPMALPAIDTAKGSVHQVGRRWRRGRFRRGRFRRRFRRGFRFVIRPRYYYGRRFRGCRWLRRRAIVTGRRYWWRRYRRCRAYYY